MLHNTTANMRGLTRGLILVGLLPLLPVLMAPVRERPIRPAPETVSPLEDAPTAAATMVKLRALLAAREPVGCVIESSRALDVAPQALAHLRPDLVSNLHWVRAQCFLLTQDASMAREDLEQARRAVADDEQAAYRAPWIEAATQQLDVLSRGELPRAILIEPEHHHSAACFAH